MQAIARCRCVSFSSSSSIYCHDYPLMLQQLRCTLEHMFRALIRSCGVATLPAGSKAISG